MCGCDLRISLILMKLTNSNRLIQIHFILTLFFIPKPELHIRKLDDDIANKSPPQTNRRTHYTKKHARTKVNGWSDKNVLVY